MDFIENCELWNFGILEECQFYVPTGNLKKKSDHTAKECIFFTIRCVTSSKNAFLCHFYIESLY